MNKKSLATAIIAGITGITGVVSVSNAVHINPDNTGQVLLYPYYNTRNDNNTLISVVNTTDAGKAIKVRFLEGVNSQEVFDFNLYLSPFDVWTAAVVDSDTSDGATFITDDTSCTVPYFYGRNFAEGNTQPDTLVNFTDLLFAGDGGPQGLDRTREGYIEMIEMAEVVNGNGVQPNENTLASITHVNDVPPGCFTVEAGFNIGTGYFLDSSVPDAIQTDMVPPAGGLFGDGTIINVAGARAFGYNATALDGFYDPAVAPVAIAPSLHTESGSTLPSIGGSGFPATSNVLLSAGNVPVLVTDTWTAPGESFSDALNAVLMVDQVLNQYAIESFTEGGTQWVVTHPNKGDTAASGGSIAPYTVPFTGGNAGALCEPALFTVFNREEAQITTEIPPLPSPFDVTLATVQLCNEVNILDFAGNGIFVSELGVELFPTEDQPGVDIPNSLSDVDFESGWAQLAFNSVTAVNPAFDVEHELINVTSGNAYQGLPVVGFATRSANAGTFQFGTAFEHAYARIITN